MVSGNPLHRIDRIRARLATGDRLAPEDARDLVGAIDAAIRSGCTLDHGLGLAPGWQITLQRRSMRASMAALFALATEANRISERQFATQLSADLAVYSLASFRTDQAAGQIPRGKKGFMFRLLSANGGRVPRPSTVRKWLRESASA